MAWIESHTVLGNHWKVAALAKAIGRDVPATVGALHLLWHTALEQQEDGVLTSWPDDRIAAAAKFNCRKSGEFVKALIEVRWLDEDRKLHDWLDYAGKYLTGKYAKRNKDRLSEIWKKYGRVYGSGERPTDSQQTSNQQSVSGVVGELNSKDSSSSKDSSLLEGPKKSPHEADAAWLTRVWLIHRGVAHTDCDRQADDYFDDLLTAGLTKETIEAEIKKKRIEGRKAEPIWDFTKRLMPAKRGQNGKYGGHLGPGRIAVDEAALDQNTRRRAAQKARSDEFAAKNPSAEPGARTGPDPARTAKDDP